MKSIHLVFLLGFTVSLSECQIQRRERCPHAAVVQNFDANRYLGTWYEDEKFFFSAELGLKCVSANYSLNADGSIRVVNSGINTMTGRMSTVVGRAMLGQEEPAKLSVQFSRFQPPAPYWILDTDYDTYSLVWSCTDFDFGRTETAWILSRNRGFLHDGTRNGLKDVLRAYNVQVQAFRKSDQTGCNQV